MGYIFAIFISGIFLSGYFIGVDAAIGTNCTVGGNTDCDAGNHEACDTGGTDLCICGAGYIDTDGLGTCDPVDCLALTEPDDGTVSYSAGTTFGSQATLSCNPGYSSDAAATSDCQADGDWSVPSYTCTIEDCGVDALSVTGNGAVNTSSGTTFGSQATFSCDSGYSPDATVTSECQANGAWDVTSHTCTIKVCPAVTHPDNGATALDSAGVMTYQATATVTCGEGFDMGGASPTIECESSGSWSPLPTCSLTGGGGGGCGDPTVPADATVVLDGGVGATGTGATATVTCVTGYEVSGGGATAIITCQAGGSWTAATCSKKDCDAPLDPADGTTTLDSAGVTTYGATSTVTCDAGFGLDTNTATATITCQADTDWSTLPACTAGDAADCGAPSPPAKGAISTPATANTEGHEATVACDTGYTLDGASTMTCQHDDTWSTPGTCSGSTSVAWSLYVLLLLGVITRLMKE